MDDSVTVIRVPRRRHRRRRGLVALFLGASLGTLGAGAFSLAIFTDTDASTGTFSTGTIDIETNPVVLFTVNAMMPGDVTTQALTVQNAGTAQLRYAMSTVATNVLGDQLTVAVKSLGTSCAVFDGTDVVTSTALDGALFGSNTAGFQAGDRTLAGGASEVLCFRISLPLASGNAFQGVSSSATFTFDAEQTANN